MYHDPALASRAEAAPRPPSAVSAGAGVAGLAGLFGWVVIAKIYGMDGPFSALAGLACCGLPMIAWSLAVDKVHRNASTGIDWVHPRPWRETIEASLTKLVGYWATWAGIALIYATCRFYWHNPYLFAMGCFLYAAPALFVLSVPYVVWLDRRLIELKDGAWSLGAWITGTGEPDTEAIWNHLRSWSVKGFFLAFMLAVLPGNLRVFLDTETFGVMTDPVRLANWLIALMFLVDVSFATVGYVVTMRPLDAHIRTANPFAAAWAAALICYPPSILMTTEGPFNYRENNYGEDGWFHWFQWHPGMLWAIGAVLVLLTAIYAWATVAFGLRFSNLTNRGILTHGPYRWTRHPAYLAKNSFWWLATIPVLTTGTIVDAVRNTLILAAVSGVYYWRAKTEERHLKLDPAYREYDAWIAEHGLVSRAFRWVALGRRGAVAPPISSSRT